MSALDAVSYTHLQSDEQTAAQTDAQTEGTTEPSESQSESQIVITDGAAVKVGSLKGDVYKRQSLGWVYMYLQSLSVCGF